MLKRLRNVLLISVLFFMVSAGVKCPIDNSGAYFTGKTKTDISGKFLKLYKCNLYSHEFWVAD
jgi:hypothetical protein